MSESQPPFTPPTLESQYAFVHPSNIPPEHLAMMQREIAVSGAYVGEVTRSGGLAGAVEIIESERPGGLLKIMPDAIRIPSDHPARQQDRYRGRIGSAIAISLANKQANLSVVEMKTTNEELAGFLQIFVTAADAQPVGEGDSYNENYKKVSYYDFNDLHRMVVEPFGEGGTKYALLRANRQYNHRPHVTDENYTVVNLDTGDALSFSYSNISRVQNGEYAAIDNNGNVRVLDPCDVAVVAGIIDPHGPDDPLRALKKDETPSPTVILETAAQIKRSELLRNLGGPIYENAHIIFAPTTVEELITFMTRSGSDYLAKQINAVVVPEEGTVALVDQEHKFIIERLLKTVGEFDDETQRAVYATIDSVRIDAKSRWTQYSQIEKIIRAAVQVNEDTTYTMKPAAELLKRLICDRYDFLEAVYSVADGLYLEVSSRSRDKGTIIREVSERLNEEKAHTYAKIFESELMETVDIARDSLHIPNDIEPVEQIVMLLKQHGYIEKGMRLVEEDTVKGLRPDISAPKWAEICMIIDRCRDNNPISEEDRAVIEMHGFSADSIALYWKSGPGSSAENIAAALVRPLSVR